MKASIMPTSPTLEMDVRILPDLFAEFHGRQLSRTKFTHTKESH